MRDRWQHNHCRTAGLALYARWLDIQATWSKFNQRDVSDEEGNRLGDDEAELVRKMVAARPRRHWEVVQKVSVLEKVMEDHNWYDRREWLLLASLKCDVAEIYD